MQLEKLRKYKKHSRWIEGIFSKNPVFVGGFALPFAVMVTNNLKNSVSISILFACSLIPTVLLSCLIGKYMAKWWSNIVYALFSICLVVCFVPLIMPISPEVVDSLGLYAPILSVNTVLLMLCERYRQETKRPVMALVDAVTYSIGFALAMCLLALVRESFGNSTIWGIPLNLPWKISGMQIAFFGFVAVALFAALWKFLHRKILYFLYRLSENEQAEQMTISQQN